MAVKCPRSRAFVGASVVFLLFVRASQANQQEDSEEMVMQKHWSWVLASTATLALGSTSGIQPATYTAPGVFPTSLYETYYNTPTATAAQVQPVITDPVNNYTYPLWLTDPDNIPQADTQDPHPLPTPVGSSVLLDQALSQIESIATNPIFADNTCSQCQAGLVVAKMLALTAPEQVPPLAVALCERFGFSTACAQNYGQLAWGSVVTQVLAYADVGGYDGQALCQNFLSLCPRPPTLPLNLTAWFVKPKPDPLPAPKQPSGERLKVLHISDVHLDPRYATGAEANCTSGLCCRSNNNNTDSPDSPIFPAPRFGAYLCDSPYSLVLSALEAIPPLTGTEEDGFAWTIFTGDLVSHDSEYQLSRDYVMYTETVLYDLFKRTLGSGPVYAVLGNHDSYDEASDAPHSLGGELGSQFSWNYDHVSSLWQYENWLPESALELSRAHYAAYMVKHIDGLRIITLNTNLWYRANYFNYINMSTNIDPSGMLRFLTDELQDAEDAGDRVWILGHVLSGWDGTNAMYNPTNLFYQIVDRYSPHVIANIFWGHTHEDQISIFYANNGTDMSAETAQTLSWIGPSVVPITNLNSGFRVYEIDSATFDVIDAYTWRSDVNSFSELDSQTEYGPTYVFEYSTREAYGGNLTWGPNDPLNATFWHLVTEAMEADPSLVETFNTYQGKSSVRTPACTGDCIPARICYIRSGSSVLAAQNCNQGYGSVQ